MKHPKLLVALVLVAVFVGGPFAWYYAPSHVEEMDQLVFCACGHSKVQFKEGIITMVKFHHDSVKSGDVIGRYSVRNKTVELEIYFGGKTNTSLHTIDNIGLWDPDALMWSDLYVAYNGKSMKYRVWHFLQQSL